MFFVIVGLALAEVQRGIRFDDPFITYRYAVNLAAGRGFVFNPGEMTLITTAPLYALLLAVVQVLGIAPHVSSPMISVASLVLGACGLWAFGRMRGPGGAIAGFVAGLVYLCAPLVWLTIGFETPLFLAVIIWALVAADRSLPIAAGVLVAVGMGLRGDGLIAAAVVLSVVLMRSLRAAAVLRFVAPVVLLYGLLAGWLTLQFGSPIPSTLQTKAAQAVSGLTGFYPFTKYPEGALLLLLAWSEQNPMFVLLPAATLAGVVVLVLRMRWDDLPASWIVAVPFMWAVMHFTGYALLGVAPYVWYYAPLVPGLAWAAGIMMERLAERVKAPFVYCAACVLVIAAMGPAHAAVREVLRGASPPDPVVLQSKILPETKVDVYETAGRWVASNTAQMTTLGMSELGVMSYFANRPTVDFLGLVRPDDSADIRHGDFLAQIIESMPQLMLMPMRNSVYDVDPQKEAWFRRMYQPVKQIEDARFWGSPLTIWERTAEAVTWTALPGSGADLGDGWLVTAVESNIPDLSLLSEGEQPLLLRARLRAGSPVGTRTLRMQPILLDGGDGLTVVSRVIYTDRWRAGEERWVHFPALTRKPGRAQAYAIEFSWLERADQRAQAAFLPAQPEDCSGARADMLPLSAEFSVALQAQAQAAPGGSIAGRLFWRAGGATPAAMHVFVHLRNRDGAIVAQTDQPLRHQGQTFPTILWKRNCLYEDAFVVQVPGDAPAETLDVVIGLYDPATGQRMPVDPAPHRTSDGGVRAGVIAIR